MQTIHVDYKKIILVYLLTGLYSQTKKATKTLLVAI